MKKKNNIKENVNIDYKKEISKEDRIITIEVKPNKELYQTLLSFGADVKVLEPEEVITELRELIKKMNDTYTCTE